MRADVACGAFPDHRYFDLQDPRTAERVGERIPRAGFDAVKRGVP
jgi:hypothetical protein